MSLFEKIPAVCHFLFIILGSGYRPIYTYNNDAGKQRQFPSCSNVELVS
jgi:hypothetical protein